jgi:hypothetical protein
MRTLFLTAILLLGQLAHAAPTVAVSLVRASHGEAHVDPELKRVSRELRALPFSRFEHLGTRRSLAATDGAHVADLGQDVRVVTEVTHVDGDHVDFVVDIFRGDDRVTHTAVTQPYDRALVLRAGRDSSGTLVVPLQVRR